MILWGSEREGKCSRHWRRHSPAIHGGHHGGAGCSSVASKGPLWMRHPPAVHENPMQEEMNVPWGKMQLVERSQRSRLLTRAAPYWRGTYAGSRVKCDVDDEAEELLWTYHHSHFLSPCNAQVVSDNEGVRLSLGKRSGDGGNVLL